jgi:solute carrier family 25 (adenine nucleotide translocator) protein 4/5/6/31
LETRYTGILNCFHQVYRNDGLASFWRGAIPSYLRFAPLGFSQFLLYEVIKPISLSIYSGNDREKLLLRNLATAAVAGSIPLLLAYPFDYCVFRTTIDTKKNGNWKYSGSIDAISRTYEEKGKIQGTRIIFRGFFLSIGTIIGYRALYFGLYDTVKVVFFFSPSFFLFSFLNPTNFSVSFAATRSQR